MVERSKTYGLGLTLKSRDQLGLIPYLLTEAWVQIPLLSSIFFAFFLPLFFQSSLPMKMVTYPFISLLKRRVHLHGVVSIPEALVAFAWIT